MLAGESSAACPICAATVLSRRISVKNSVFKIAVVVGYNTRVEVAPLMSAAVVIILVDAAPRPTTADPPMEYTVLLLLVHAALSSTTADHPMGAAAVLLLVDATLRRRTADFPMGAAAILLLSTAAPGPWRILGFYHGPVRATCSHATNVHLSPLDRLLSRPV